MRTFTKSILVIFGLATCVATPPVANYVMAGLPKVGRLVDAATGEGIPNALVLTASRFHSSPIVHGSANEWLHHDLTYTDVDGNFHLPSAWGYTKFGLPGTDSGTTWLVTAFKPGYAIEGDEKAWSFDESGDAPFRPRSTEFSPAATWLVLYVQLRPIKMVRQDFTLKEAAVYYRRVAAVGLTLWGSSDPREIPVRRLGFGALVPVVCAMEDDEEIDAATADALRFFAIDHEMSERRLKELEPYSYTHGASFPVTYRARSMCEALRAAGS